MLEVRILLMIMKVTILNRQFKIIGHLLCRSILIKEEILLMQVLRTVLRSREILLQKKDKQQFKYRGEET